MMQCLRNLILAASVLCVLLLSASAATIAADPDILSAEDIASKLVPTRGLRIVTSVNLPTVTFEFGSFDLTSQARRQLAEVAKALSMSIFEQSRFMIAGHTDAVGAATYNQRLSELRAQVVVDDLVQTYGLDRMRLSIVGYGESQLLPDKAQDSGENRRVEIVNLGSGS